MTVLSDLTGAPPGMTTRTLLLRLSAIGAVVTGSAGTFAYAGGWLSPAALTPGRVIDRFEQVNGPHPGFRRNHAKGLCVAGSFASNGAGARLSRASVFPEGRVTPVEGRVALAGGQPYAADAEATVRSLALRFRLPHGEEWRTGVNNIPVFPVRTPEAFYEQLLAAQPEPATGKPDPDRLKAFFAAHPESAKAAAVIKARTVSSGFADSTFSSLNAFRFAAADGHTSSVRWAFVPEEEAVRETAAQTARADKNDLFDAFSAQLQRHPQRWHLIVTVGQGADATADATLPWPADRESVDVGTLTLTGTTPEEAGNCRDINFDPLVLPDGIGPSDDPLLSARSAAYSRSFTRRAGEKKTPSAVAATAVRGAGL
ncbi:MULTISPECIES: catalase family peroxidase [Methylobacterium]|uniref:catalase family peroxidase n=1 Tax=Methylobacterium TaxID=407 RepID=UPI0011C7B244|nr:MULTISPECIES: catalase family peroxidase [Methylobacterium]TXN44654.1 catalase family peroxidase [Methylobacterium sp. WL7]GJE24735.1 Catalase-related peroxidase [Methylobacterium mesophilicum]